MDPIAVNMTNGTTTNHTDGGAFEQLTKGLYMFGIPIICVFGILGNLVSFRVFVFTRFKKHSSSLYIVALTVSDTIFLWSLFLSWLGNGRIGICYGHYPVWCHIMIYVTYVCSFLSVWYVVLIMVDRYIVVCHSLHVPNWCSKRRARIAIVIVSSFGALIYAHMFFTMAVKGENCTLEPKPFMMQIVSIVIYVDTVITFIFPFAVIIVLNVIVVSSVRRFVIQHTVSKGRPMAAPPNILSKAQYRITRTFILISVMLLVTNVPSHGIRFYIVLKGLIQTPNPQLALAQHICQVVYYTNYATNFLLYTVSSRIFRKYVSCKHVCYYFSKRRYDYTRNALYQ